MPIVKKLSRCCKRCGELYKPNTKHNGICDKCRIKTTYKKRKKPLFDLRKL